MTAVAATAAPDCSGACPSRARSGLLQPAVVEVGQEPAGVDARRGLALALILVVVAAGCALGGGTLGGRSTCWPEADQRAPSLWRGILRIDAAGARLDTPEGDAIPLLPGELEIRIGANGVGELGDGGDVIARAGDDVTLFGGAGADGALVVCAVEEMHG